MRLVEKVKMRMLKAGTDSQGGFSLVELIVVLALGGLLAAVLPPRLNALMESASYRKTVHDSANALEHARTQAILDGRRVHVAVDVNAGRLTSDDALLVQLPSSVEMSVSGVALMGHAHPALFFDPDGSASGGRIVVTGKSRSTTIDLDWLTGQISIKSASR